MFPITVDTKHYNPDGCSDSSDNCWLLQEETNKDEDEEKDLVSISEFEYTVRGAMDLDDLNDELHLNLVSEDFDSVGGFVFGLLDHLPSQGEELTTDNGIYFKVISMDKNRVDKLYLRIPVDFYSTSA